MSNNRKDTVVELFSSKLTQKNVERLLRLKNEAFLRKDWKTLDFSRMLIRAYSFYFFDDRKQANRCD